MDNNEQRPTLEDIINKYGLTLWSTANTAKGKSYQYMDYDMTTWLWETCWRTYDYKYNIVEGIFECGNSTDYGVASREAFTSYTAMVVMEEQSNG